MHKQQPTVTASRVINFQDKFTDARPLLKKLNALTVYQLNINNTLFFMHKVKNNDIPNILKQNIINIPLRIEVRTYGTL